MEISNLALIRMHAGHRANGDPKLVHRIRGHDLCSIGGVAMDINNVTENVSTWEI
jgi:hypothetical protein